MELWFILAIISLIAAGLQVFLHKVSSVRGYNSNLVNGAGAGIAALIGFVVVGVRGEFSEFSLLMVTFAFLSGLLYMFSSNLRMDSLRYINTTIALPLHKFISPLVTLLFGILLFQEHINFYEFIGILIGVLVPLTLITKSENNRQVNLRKGVTLITISASISALSAVVNKTGADIFVSALLFAAFTNAFSALTGIILHAHGKAKKAPALQKFDVKLVSLIFATGILHAISLSTLIMSFSFGGSLAVVYTITSLYIVIPIVLSIIFYNEHWNTRKVIAIVLSILAVFLMR